MTAETVVPTMIVDESTPWALAARAGDRAAAAAFVRCTQADVWRFVAALVDPGSADDLTQETYLRALPGLTGFEGRSSARTWLLGIARRVCADHIRSTVRRRRLLARTVALSPAEPVATDPAGTDLELAELLARLRPTQRTAFELTQLLGLSYAEAAEVMGVPIGTVRSRVARARSELVEAVQRTYTA
jgi:RNA polymerase sigma-70 factor (ECF subfamily)